MMKQEKMIVRMMTLSILRLLTIEMMKIKENALTIVK